MGHQIKILAVLGCLVFSVGAQAQWTSSWSAFEAIGAAGRSLRDSGIGIYCRSFSEAGGNAIDEMNRDLQKIKMVSGVDKITASAPQFSDKASGGTMVCITLSRGS